jgi:hypothetical protein
MWPFPRKHFKWREPAPFREEMAKAGAASSAWWGRLVVFAVNFTLLMSVWGIARLNPQKPPVALGVAVGLASFLGLFVACIVPWLGKRLPSEVMVLQNRIFRTNGFAQADFRWEKIASFSVLRADRFQVLALELVDGRRAYVGMPVEVDAEALGAFLERQGVRRKPIPRGLQWTGPHRSAWVN